MDSDKVHWMKNGSFDSTTLSEIFGTKNLTSDLLNITLELISAFNFNTPETYHRINEKITQDSDYKPIVLGNVRLPNKSANNAEIELPFTYNYTIVPCMNYGKLDHLSVSNTVNFNNLYNFSDSTFNVWRYRVDGPTVHLLFGTEINDLYQTYKVKALVLEFYDLWGFAGSLIIDNKKPGAYSGVFNKILTLNTLQMLSRKKVKVPKTDNDSVIGTYSETYARNINITKDTTNDTYTLYNKPVKRDPTLGWVYVDGEKPVENDCGILYPNIMYGVKAYFVQDTPNTKSNGEQLFTLKEQFFMFTSPIFNNYYYSERNYNNITNPKLDFVMAYKLLDKSDKTPYTNSEVGIKDGYKTNGKLYPYSLGLSTADTYLEEPIYYQYKGTTRLSMEIGLKKEYENINLSYLRDVNNYFGCRLQLVNNDETGTVSINSDGVTLNNTAVLKYPNTLYNPNTLYFSDNSLELTINSSDFSQYGFLDGVELKYIDINYNFTVGYNVIISDIKKTNVPATTVCALCHKRDDGTYNYEDFGIYLKDGLYLSDTMFYNSGTGDEVEFGLCRQTQTTGNIINQCNISYSSNYDAVDIRNIRKLNIGDPLKKIIENVGKLSFCSPYVAGLSEKNGVNICHNSKDDKMYITPNLDGLKESHNDTYGTAPARALYNNPLYTMCVHTKDMVNYNSEFAVNMAYVIQNITTPTFIIGRDKSNPYDDTAASKIPKNISYIPAAEYVGLNGMQLSEFNKKLLNTMKSVYAYNPDYNYLSIYAGLISITDNKIQFVSNLLCDLAKWDTKQSLNDYVSFGSYKFSNYFKSLTSNSDNIIKTKEDDVTWIPLLNFGPNLYYCGESNPVLISSLTYNTPVTSDMYESLQFNSTDCVAVRHEDGYITKLYGDLNKKALYGFKYATDNLIQLDVSNYEIDKLGNILFTSEEIHEHIFRDLKFNVSNYYTISHNTESFNINIFPYTDKESIVKLDKNRKILWYLKKSLPNGVDIYTSVTYKNNTNKLLDAQCLFNISVIKVNTSKMSSVESDVEFIFENLEFENLYQLFTKNTVSLNDKDGNVQEIDSNELFKDGPIDLYLNNKFEGLVLNRALIKYTLTSKPKPVPILIVGEENENFMILIELIEVRVFLKYNSINSNASIINVSKSNHYYNNSVGPDKGYTVIVPYENRVIRGTSITLNDLVYEPNQLGHRLYLRPGCFRYEGVSPSKKLFYRTLTPTAGETDPTWQGKNYYKNGIFINAGPCFEPDKL